MKKETKSLITSITVSSLVSTLLILGISTYKDVLATNTIQSQGKIEYINPETGDKVILDTSDHILLQTNIESNSDEIEKLNENIIIAPTEQVTKEQGLEDTPVGNILTFMGTEAPEHYLVCDGSEYNIDEYPYLAEHIKTEFGTYNHFGGDGIQTFAVPDLRGEFLRGSGTATRDTGSGAEVGDHQDPTEHTYIYGDAKSGNSAVNYTLGNPLSIDQSRSYKQGESNQRVYISNGTRFNSSLARYISRPTNTSVLYCIKAEPTYYMIYNN